MDKVTYYYETNYGSPSHHDFYKGTFAISLPSIEDLMSFASHSVFSQTELTHIRIGHAKRHKDDAFVKKIGRDLSKSRMAYEDFCMKQFTRHGDLTSIILQSPLYRLHLHVYPNRIYIHSIGTSYNV
jgi:hypothetical protein